MADRPEKRYWDAASFIAMIKEEPGRGVICDEAIQEARTGRCVIFTSTITLAEVTKKKSGIPNPRDSVTEEQIAGFFKNEYIKIVPTDYSIGVLARQLIWEFPHLGPRDAIHVATAIQADVDCIETYDNTDFGRLAREIAASGNEELKKRFPIVREPKGKAQGELAL